MSWHGSYRGRSSYPRRYGYRRKYPRQQKPNAQSRLSTLLAGIDVEIRQIFFSLPEPKLHELFNGYADEHGESAAGYARATYEKWKSGSTMLSGQTAERVINLLPRFLSSDVKYGFVKKLRDQYKPAPVRRFVATTFEKWKQDLLPVVNAVVKSGEVEFPQQVLEKAEWLSDGDCVAARGLMERAELEEAKIRLSYLRSEMGRLEELVSQVQNAGSVQHKISLPQGTIDVTIVQPKKSFWQMLFGG